MTIFRHKRSFSSGELTPLMGARFDLKRFINGATTLRNMYVRPQGPVSRRQGSEFILDVTPYYSAPTGNDIDDSYYPRIIPFVFSEDQAYVLIFLTDYAGASEIVIVKLDDTVVATVAITGTAWDFDLRHFDYAQSNDILNIVQRQRPPQELTRASDTSWSIADTVFTNQPSDWETSSTNGWPAFVAYYEQRIVYASTYGRPQTIWLSKAGDYNNFGVSSPLVEDDAITFTLDSGVQNKFAWLSSSTNLLIGTIGSEWTLGGLSGDPLSYRSVKVRKQTNLGGEDLKPITVNASTIFLEMLGKKAQRFIFDYNTQSYQTMDLNILAPHLTENSKIVNWTFQKHPNSIIWCARQDGDLLGLTFQQEHQVFAWHRHDFVNGKIKDLCTIPGVNEDWVYAIVERTIDGDKKYYLERFAEEFKSDTVEGSYFLDSYKYFSGTDIQVLTGLDHLEGETVDVLADGTVHPSCVVSGGSITLDNKYSTAVVGLPFVSQVSPTFADIDLATGSTVGREQRITNIVLELYKTIGVEYGRSWDRLEQLSFRYKSNLTGEQLPLFTGLKHVSFPEGYDRKPTICIQQTQPLPLTVLGIVDEVNVTR